MNDAIADSTESLSLAEPVAVADSARWLFARMANPEVFLSDGAPVEVLRAELRRASVPTDASLDSLTAEAADWSAAAAMRFRAIRVPTDLAGRQFLVRKAALWWAPIGLASGAWLQWLVSPANADQPLFLKILNLYASDVGAGHPGTARGNAYLGFLRQLRASEYAMPIARLASDQRIDGRAFRLPAMLLLMSRRPDEFCSELMGADFCLRSVGMPPPLVLAESDLQIDWTSINCSSPREEGAASPLAECRSIVEFFAGTNGKSAGRVFSGFAWALSALREDVGALHDQLEGSLDPWFDMAELMKLRANEGSVYHERVQLEGRSLQAWLEDCRSDPGPFLDALSRSRYVKPGHSDISSLVNGLVAARGPMFRIFSPEDLVVIRRWIDSLGESTTTSPPARSNAAQIPAVNFTVDQPWLSTLPALIKNGPISKGDPANLRDAFHRLLTPAGSFELRDWSVKYIHGWLARSRHRMGPDTGPLPSTWKPEGLRPWLQVQHTQHAAAFTDIADRALPSREAVVDDAVQKGLLTLIDGSWLQGFADYELASSDVGHSLFSTYWDELGNGKPELNHLRIYREVLKSMDLHIPPTASPEFVTWPGFRDDSFELPVYWLAIGRFPKTFLPEVLGLNLAMELSGVGGNYRRAHMALRKYGFSTHFVDIHNTIDNVATGHSAWAADAIDTVMASLPGSSGPGGRSEAWDRVRTGYRSLNPPSGFMARKAGVLARLTRGRRRRPEDHRAGWERV